MPSGSNFTQISLQTAGQYVQVNNSFQAVVPANYAGIELASTSALTAAFFGGDFWSGSAVTNVADSTLALTASATNYVEETITTGAITKNTSSFTAGRRPLYTLATGATGITLTGIVDYRRIAWQDANVRFNQVDAFGTTFALANTTATTINIGGAATTMSVGAGAASSLNLNFTTAIALNTSAVTTNQTTVTAFAGATTLLTLGGTGATSVLNVPGTKSGTSSTSAAVTLNSLGVAENAFVGGKINSASPAASDTNSADFTGTTTGANYIRIFNAGCTLGFGVDKSAGGFLVGGGSAYAAVIYTPKDLVLCTSNGVSPQVTITASTGQVTFNDANNTSAFAFHTFTSNSATAGSITRVAQTAVVTYNTTSDERLKNDLGIATDTGVLRALKIHDFEWRENGVRGIGVFAQEAHKVWADPITVGGDDPKMRPWGAGYSTYVPHLIVGWQDHERRLQQLESAIKH